MAKELLKSALVRGLATPFLLQFGIAVVVVASFQFLVAVKVRAVIEGVALLPELDAGPGTGPGSVPSDIAPNSIDIVEDRPLAGGVQNIFRVGRSVPPRFCSTSDLTDVDED